MRLCTRQEGAETDAQEDADVPERPQGLLSIWRPGRSYFQQFPWSDGVHKGWGDHRKLGFRSVKSHGVESVEFLMA